MASLSDGGELSTVPLSLIKCIKGLLNDSKDEEGQTSSRVSMLIKLSSTLNHLSIDLEQAN